MQIDTQDIDALLTTGASIDTIHKHLAGGHHTQTYKALTCKFQHDSSHAGTSRSICAVTALNCVRLALQLEVAKADEDFILGSFVSEEMINHVMGIANDLSVDSNLEIEDLLEVPIFKETIVSAVRERGHPKDLFIRFFPPESLKPIIAVVFTQTPEHLVCFRFQSFDSCIFAIFDAHSRSAHPFGPAFILASDVDTMAAHFNQLLAQSSTSQPASKQDVTAKPDSFTTLVIESREISSTIDIKDLLTKSVAYLSGKFGTTDHTPTLDLGTPDPCQLEQLRDPLRAQTLADAAHKQDNNRQTTHSKPSTPARKKDVVPSTKLTRDSEFGWQLNLQVSATSSVVDSENDKDPDPLDSPNPLEIKTTPPTINLPKKNEFDWLASLMHREHVDIPLGSASKSGKENIPDTTLPHMRSRTEFGWQLALQQQPLKMDRHKLEGGKDLEIMTSAVAPQVDILTHGGVLGKEKEKTSEEEEELALPYRYTSQEDPWLLALHNQLRVEEDKARNAVASSSSLSRPELGQVTSTHHHELDLKPLHLILPFIQDESLTIHHNQHHSSMLTANLDTIQRSSRGFTTLELPSGEIPVESHECGVCNELYGAAQIIQLPTCTHPFCRQCLRTFTKTKITEGRYPIFCPVCAIERRRVNQSHITQEIVERLELSKQDLDKLCALQLVAHSVTLNCPKCKQTMNVDRREYFIQRTIMCPLPACRHNWCKECLKPLATSQTKHNCKQHGFDQLMRRKGWKYCPGCNTPIQKETGCNHMTCGSPGCNVHFCYKCGISIIDTSNGGDVGSAVTEHYTDCVMFEKRRRCIIQ